MDQSHDPLQAGTRRLSSREVDPARLGKRIREMLKTGVSAEDSPRRDSRSFTRRSGLAARVGESFTVELVRARTRNPQGRDRRPTGRTPLRRTSCATRENSSSGPLPLRPLRPHGHCEEAVGSVRGPCPDQAARPAVRASQRGRRAVPPEPAQARACATKSIDSCAELQNEVLKGARRRGRPGALREVAPELGYALRTFLNMAGGWLTHGLMARPRRSCPSHGRTSSAPAWMLRAEGAGAGPDRPPRFHTTGRRRTLRP